jgi:hypothetical protein
MLTRFVPREEFDLHKPFWRTASVCLTLFFLWVFGTFGEKLNKWLDRHLSGVPGIGSFYKVINNIIEKIDNQIELSNSEKTNIQQYRQYEKTFLKKKKEYVAVSRAIPFYQNNPYYTFDENTMNWKKVKDSKNSVKKTLEDSDDEEEMVVSKPKSKKTQKAPDSDDEE